MICATETSSASAHRLRRRSVSSSSCTLVCLVSTTFALASSEIHRSRIMRLQSSRAAQCSSRCTRVTCNASSSPAVSLKRFADAEQTEVVTERRAADVAVLGSSTAAVLAAYTLAKSGRKVLLLSDYGLSAPTPRPRPLQPLKLPDPDPLLTHLAAESAAYWGGLQQLTGAPLLAGQQSLDVLLDPERDHAGATGFSKLQESCAAVGVPSSLLSASEVNSSYRQLQLPPHRASALLQPDGGVIRTPQAAAAARQLATNAGVMLRDGLVLRGWRDRGSCFELRAGSNLDGTSTCLYEAEVLLLAPGTWAHTCLGLFGLEVEGLQAREVVHTRLAVSNTEQLQQLPLLHAWGAAAAADAPQQPEGWTLLPSGVAGDTRVTLQQAAAWGVPVTCPFDWQQAQFTVGGPQQEEEEEQGSRQQHMGTTWADLQIQQLHDSCSQLIRGLAPLQHPSCSPSTSLVNTLPDGRPLVGCHPGFDAGRVLVCSGAAGSTPYGPGSTSSSYQFSPVLAKLASDLIKAGGTAGGGTDSTLLGVSLHREGLEVSSSSIEALDAWQGLGRLQQATAVSDLQREEQQDLARDAERDLMGSKQ